MLDVTIASTGYVVEYLPSMRCVGVSNVNKAVFGWEGFDHPFDDLEGARDFLLSLLDNAYGPRKVL
jgi:hypothetical protein